MQFTKSLYLLGIHRLSLNRICKYSEHSWPYLVNNKVTRYCTYDDWWCKTWWRYSHLFQHYSYLLSYTRVLHDMRFNKNTTKDGSSHTATGTVVVTSGTGNNLYTPTTYTQSHMNKNVRYWKNDCHDHVHKYNRNAPLLKVIRTIDKAGMKTKISRMKIKIMNLVASWTQAYI